MAQQGKSEIRLNVIFLLFIVTGAVFIGVGKFAEYRAAAIWVPPLIMIVYFTLGSIIMSRSGVARDQFGDSVYYMGFIFTLIALLTSLATVATSSLEEGDTPKNSQAVVSMENKSVKKSNFDVIEKKSSIHTTETKSLFDIDSLFANLSIALSTTIIGLIFRIMIVNFARETMDQDQVDSESNQTMTSYIAKLEAANKSFDQYNETIKVSISQVIQDMSVSTQEQISEVRAEFTNSVKLSVKNFFNALDAYYKKVEACEMPKKLFNPIENEIESFAKQMTSYNQSIVANTEKQTGIAEQNEILHKKLADSISHLSSFEGNLKLLGDSSMHLKDYSDSVITLNQQLETLNGGVEGVVNHLGDFNDIADKHKITLEKCLNEAGQTAEVMNKHLNDTAQFIVDKIG